MKRWLNTMIACCCISQVSFAANIDQVKKSKWRAIYQDDDATFVVNNTVTLDGSNGNYVTESGQKGKLFNVRYAYLTAKAPRKVGVYGNWRLGNQTGAFTFRVAPSGKKFAGTWTGGNDQRGTWSGNVRKWDDEDEADNPTPVDPGPVDRPDDEPDTGEDPGPVDPSGDE